MKRVLFMALMVTFVLAACDEGSVDDVLEDNQDAVDNDVTIEFDSNDGTEVDDLVVSLDDFPSSLEAPTREGYAFAGWYFDEAFAESFSVSEIGDVDALTLYAQWDTLSDDDEPDEDSPSDDDDPLDDSITIVFDSDGGSEVNDLEISLANLPQSLPEPSKDAHQFMGWYLDESFAEAFDLNALDSDTTLTLYARWVPLYEVTFVADDSVLKTETVLDGETLPEASHPEKEGHVFEGWYLDNQFGDASEFDENTPVTEALMLYAKFTPNTYTISFEAEGHTLEPIEYEYGTGPVIPDLDDEGFMDWYLEDTYETPLDDTDLPANDITLHAFISPVFTIEYYVDDDLVDTQTLVVGEGIEFPEETPSKTGHTFLGWRQFNDEYTFEYFVNEGSMMAMDATLEAVFEANEYTVSFDDPSMEAFTLSYGEGLNVDDYEDPLFIGWYLDDALSVPFEYDTMPAYDITLHAKVADANDVLSLNTVLTYELTSARIEASVIHYEYMDLVETHLYILTDGEAQLMLALDEALDVTVDGKVIDATVHVDYTEEAFAYDLSAINVLGDMTDPLSPTFITIDELGNLDFNDPNSMATIYSTEGFLVTDEGYATLFDAQTNTFYPLINISSSTAYDTMLNNLAHTYVSFAFVTMPTDEGPFLIYLEDIEPMTALTLNDSEKLTLLSDLIDAIYGVESFQVGDAFDLPDPDPFFGSALSAQFVGDNAQYYDAVNDEFLYTEEDQVLDVDITLTLGNETMTLSTTVLLEGMTPDSLSDVEADTFYTLKGTIFHTTDTHVLFGDGDTLLWLLAADTPSYTVGDTYTVNVMTYSDGYTLKGDLIEVLEEDGASQDALTPSPMTLQALSQLNDVHTSLYHTFEGVVLSNESIEYPYILSDGINQVYLPDTPAVANALGEKVSVDLFIVDYLEDTDTSGYVGIYEDSIHTLSTLTFDILEQMDFAETLMQPYLQNVYRPNVTYAFPLAFDDLGFPITYTLIGGQASDVTMVENGDLQLTFTDEGIFNFDIHIQVNGLNRQLSEAFIVEDYTITSLDTALNDTPGTIHTFELRVDGFTREHDTILTDGTEVAIVSETLFTTYFPMGQTLIVSGTLVQDNGLIWLDNATIEQQTTSTIPLTQTNEVTFDDLELLSEPYDGMLHVELEGIIDFPPSDSDMAIVDTDGSYYLLGRDPSDGTWFNHLGETVQLRGYFTYSEDFGINIIAISDVTPVPE
ncbi:MAG: InlB B-repeat-containing protein [Bacillota bacterium]